MGQDGFQSNTGTLKTEGGNFAELGRNFASAVVRLQNGLSALEGGGAAAPPSQGFSLEQQAQGFVKGLTTLSSKASSPPWGDDEIGEKFGVVYEGLRDGMYESMGHLAAKLQEIGKALGEMAKNHEANEDFNESLMKQHVDNSFAWQPPGGTTATIKPV